jgi:4-hydroxythreonine-4-phosphate dehydrogenase
MQRVPRILITPGEPAGIGPEITAKIAQLSWNAELICVCDPELLLPLPVQIIDLKNPAEIHQPGILKCIPVKLSSPCIPGKLNLDNANYVLECLKIATAICIQTGAALVTGPVNKSIINDAGIAFTGHTEFLAQQCQVKNPIMLFVADQLRVALATTHLPLAEVSKNITQEKLISTLRLLHQELQKKFRITHPKILICGLNPHAGEMGHLGREEIDTIEPALKQLRAENIDVIGPLAADTIFTEKYLKMADAVLAMYHDQALPVVKYLSFGHAVNVTLGLPIVRTSVDHGTALDIAGTKSADAGSLVSAIQLAIELSL